MKVALVTTWQERCGIAEYALELVHSLPEVEFEIIGRPFSANEAAGSKADIVHLNYEPGLMGFWDAGLVQRLQGGGKKVILTLHTSHAGNNCNSFTGAFSRVIVHERTEEGFDYIPMGISEAVRSPSSFENSGDIPASIATRPSLGTAGFPFSWKGFWTVAEVARDMGLGLKAVIPESPHGDAIHVKQQLLAIHPQAEIETSWMPRKETVEYLSECAVQVFAYSGGNCGISGAVRLGLATGKPTVITPCRQFRDLYEDYPDEIYLAVSAWKPDIQNAVTAAISANGSAKMPKRILQDMDWRRVGQMYKKIYDEVLAC